MSLPVGTLVLIVGHPEDAIVGRVGTVVKGLTTGVVYLAGHYVIETTYGIDIPSMPVPEGYRSWACKPSEVVPIAPNGDPHALARQRRITDKAHL